MNNNSTIAPPPQKTYGYKCRRLIRTSAAWFALGLYEDAEAVLAPWIPPRRWRVRYEYARISIAWARGDVEKVIAIGRPLCLETYAPAVCYDMASIALHKCGRSAEAIAVIEAKLRHYATDEGDHYDLACFTARLGDGEASLRHLHAALAAGGSNMAKALIDTDLQALWCRLPFMPLTEEICRLLCAPEFAAFVRRPITPDPHMVRDITDAPVLPPVFARWIVPAANGLDHILSFSAPLEVRRHFHDWTLARAHSTRRLIRRAVAAAHWQSRLIGFAKLAPKCGSRW